MVLNIKNMVCDRCIQSIRNVLDKRNLSYDNLDLGSVMLQDSLSANAKENLNEDLKTLGFEILEDTEIIEVKQGPYAGDEDKTRITQVESQNIIMKDTLK